MEACIANVMERFMEPGGGAYSLSTLNPHDACGTIRFVGNYQLQAGRPSGSGAKVRHGMRGQRDARLNLDFHAMTEAPESQMHVVDRVRCVLRHAINHNPVAQKTKSPDRRSSCRGSGTVGAGEATRRVAWLLCVTGKRRSPLLPQFIFVQNFSCVQLLVIEPKIFMTKVYRHGECEGTRSVPCRRF